MAAETCAVCGETVPFDASAHVLLNPPDDPVRDGYLCPSCYEDHFEGVLKHVEVAETGDEDDEDGSAEDQSTEDTIGGDADDDPADDEAATENESVESPDEPDEDGPGDDPADPSAEAETDDADS